MKRSWIAPGLVTLLVGAMVTVMPACSSDDAVKGPDGSGGTDANSSAGEGSGGSPDAAGGADSEGLAGSAGAAGAVGGSGESGDAGSSTGPEADALPETTFLYVYSETADHDVLVARDLVSGEERVVTDLRGDGSEGWEIWGHSISPDRRRIAIASLFGPTAADNATQLATRRIWTLATDGSDFRRLTPVFDNTGAGQMGFNISVQDPAFTADGSGVIYDFGNWWYESTTLKGGSLPWLVPTSGDVPELFSTITSCSVIDPSVNPATGEVLFVHSVCVDAADEGIFLYPSTGGTEPVKLIDRGYGPGTVDPSLEKASWVGDGSGFVFVGNIEVTRGDVIETATSLLAYDMATGDIGVVVIPEAGTSVRNAAVSPDGSAIVYCLAHDDVHDLRAIDLTVEPAVDVALTDDGKSCSPGF